MYVLKSNVKVKVKEVNLEVQMESQKKDRLLLFQDWQIEKKADGDNAVFPAKQSEKSVK